MFEHPSFEKFRNQKLVTIGNSYAVVVPKKVCRLLRLDRTTEISLSLQDDAIVIRAIHRADRTRQPDRSRVHKVLAILIRHYQMKEPDFDRLSHDGRSLRAFLSDVNIGGHLDLITVARLGECLGRRRELERKKLTETWVETVETVLLQIPSTVKPEEPASSNAASKV